jgi:hypothetical protein
VVKVLELQREVMAQYLLELAGVGQEIRLGLLDLGITAVLA